ncbi:RNA-binding cell elongation regulator Jag/EloR [Caldicoprobacter faecalis]|uniref:RNA-binding cell elongation regulator Jag/EloR n=1 Tax=Caldicoprobacter faecalis TaxID=937334 RepID=UPI000B89B4EF|nr:RNA-binding cell elongation regulator Jag/EloR [Caldicoprobacter faecalis]
MVRSVETTGKTIEEAILMAVAKLGVQRDNLDIEIFEEPVKGLFGIIGGRNARIRATIKRSVKDEIKEFLSRVLELMGIEAKIEITEEESQIMVKLSGQNMGLVIGRRGETLDALQYITNLAVNRNKSDYKRIIIDTEEYRSKREETLRKLAKRLANKVQRTKKSIVLEPMNPYERRIIHSTLQNHPYVTTYSEGEEPYRKVVIKLK